MNFTLFNMLRLTTLGISLLFTIDAAYSSTWYICTREDWDQKKCGYVHIQRGMRRTTGGMRWSYKECKNFKAALDVPAKVYVNSPTPDSYKTPCEVK